jgi:E3 ubiquitin-protein ligase RAD18
MYNETKLRQLLAELGLPIHGNKALLSARHKEYVNLHNANIDRRYPQSQRELLKQLERWDATQQVLARGEKRKEVDGKEWAAKWGDDFADLARQARESAKRRKTESIQNGEKAKDVSYEEITSSQEGTMTDCIL